MNDVYPNRTAADTAGPQTDSDSVGRDDGPGQLDRYEFRSLIGTGGMGRVFRVYDRRLDREVALKMIRDATPQRCAHFLSEARNLARLQHPNILRLYELGTTESLQPYYTMPLVKGRPLDALVTDLRSGDTDVDSKLTLLARLRALLDVAGAVEYAHRCDVVHGDLKPANIMLAEHGAVTVLDWGLSRWLTGAGEPSGRTRRGPRGTPLYMAPEQARGQPLERPADVYSLGVVLYELLTLERPFNGSVEAIIEAHASRRPELPSCGDDSVPPAMAQLALAALSKEPSSRPSAGTLRDAIAAFLASVQERTEQLSVAAQHAAVARASLGDYRTACERVTALAAQVAELRPQVEPWRPLADKRQLLAVEEQLERATREVDAYAGRLVVEATEALTHDPDHRTAREVLADYHWDRLLAAETSGDTFAQHRLHEIVATYDDGKRERELRGEGTLQLTTSPVRADVVLQELEDDGFQLVAGPERPLGSSPLGPIELRHGSYVLTLRATGRAEVKYPVLVARGRTWTDEVLLYRSEMLLPGFLPIPGTTASTTASPVADFALSVHPITLGDYMEFIHDLDDDEGVARAPGEATSTYLERHADGRYRIPDRLPSGVGGDPRLPVTDISWLDADAYARWRADRDGAPHRLPTLDEWRHAAAGVDGRVYPWGNRFDPSLANVRGSREAVATLVTVEDFPTDVSVYGIRSLGGNGLEWTATSERERGYFQIKVASTSYRQCSAELAQISTALPYPAETRSEVLGFRLAYSLPWRRR